MMNFILVAAGVFVGTLAATAVMLLLAFNKKVLKAYSSYLMKVTMEITEEMTADLLSKEEELA